MNLEQRHPDWQKFESRWRMARCFWLGGIHVLSPDYPATYIGTWIKQDASDGEATEQQHNPNGDYRWSTSQAHSFLWKHERETHEEYEMRHERIINPPLFQYIVNTLSAGVLRSRPDRETVSGVWADIHQDFDGVGTDVDAWMRRALAMGLVYGRAHAVADRRAYDTPALSAGMQSERGERAFAYLVSPLDVVDWSVDDRGAFRWVVLREDEPDQRGPGEMPERSGSRYRIRYPDHWELWVANRDRTSRETWVMIDSGPLTGIGVSTLYATRCDQPNAMGIETALADFLDGNRYTLNKFSELDEIDRTQTFSQMAIPTLDGQVGIIGVGPRRYIGYPSEAGAPSFISPDASLAEGKYARVADMMHMWRQLAGIGRGQSEYSKEERSAAALTVESEDKRNQLAWWSKALNEFDHAVHADLAKLEGQTDWPRAQYPTNYDVKAIMTQIAEAVQLVAGVPLLNSAHEVQSAVVRPIIRKMLGDGGAEDAEIDAVLAQLDAAIADAKADKEREIVAKEKAAEKPAAAPFGQKEEPADGAA